jgi:hypothetical protein
MGKPMTTPMSVDLNRSSNQRRSVILLNPKRCSITKVWYSVSGKSINPLISAKPASKASCCTMPPSSHAISDWFRASSPPSKCPAQQYGGAEGQFEQSETHLVMV